MNDMIIDVSGLEKSYGNVKAVKGIDFYVTKGSLFAFLGVNGAGKSTTIDMLCTQLAPDAGQVIINGNVLGKQDEAIRRDIGIVFQDNILDKLLTVRENIMCRGSLYGMKGRILKNALERAVEITGVQEILNRPYGKLSGGQRRRADVARALINTPKILFLDEPTTGLDPQTRQNIWQTLRNMQKETGMTIFLTTHYMEEASEADYITIIQKGEIVVKGTPIELKENHTKDSLSISAIEKDAMQKRLQSDGVNFVIKAGRFVLPLNNTMQALGFLEKYKENIQSFEVLQGTLDDVFISISSKAGE